MDQLISFSRPYLLQPLVLKKKIAGYNPAKFFLSFEDSLHYLFLHYNINKQKEHCLVPNFYCPETLKFINQFCQVVFYEINDDFSVNWDSYFKQIESVKPRVIINYSYIGFKQDPAGRERLGSLLNEQSILIDDYAHRILVPDEVKNISKNHFFIDSIRKHGPLLGSHIVNPELKVNPEFFQTVNFYKIRSHFFQMLEGLLNFLAYRFNSSYWNELSETVFCWQDDSIGNNSFPTKGSLASFFLYNHLDVFKLREHKKKIVKNLTEKIVELNCSYITTIDPKLIVNAEINYYPLLVNKEYQEELIDFLRSRKIIIENFWEVEDAYPALNRKLYESFLIIPLTYLIKERDVHILILAIKEFINQKK